MNKLPTIELQVKITKPEGYEPTYFNSKEDLKPFISDFELKATEDLSVIHLNTQNEIVGVQNIAHGTIDNIVVDPYEILQGAYAVNVKSILLIHNHPSANSTQPSFSDIAFTRDVIRKGQAQGINVKDHLIVAQGQKTYSFKENLPEAWD